MTQVWKAVFVLMVLLCAVFGGVLIGQGVGAPYYTNMHHGDSHARFHRDLQLDDVQAQKMEVIEHDFRRQRILFEKQMKVANMELAEAIKSTGYTSLEVQDAVDKIHHSMGKLQKLMLQHLFDMDAILTEEQNKIFKEDVVDQLYRNAE